MKTTVQPSTYEQIVVSIMRNLPHERILDLVNFARFLDFNDPQSDDEWLDEEKIKIEKDIHSEKKWDQLLAQPKAKNVLREMAREAREDYLTGRTTGINITEDGRLVPL